MAPTSIRAMIKRANSRSTPGPSGLRYRHLQAGSSMDLVDDLNTLARMVIESETLPNLFWTLHARANLLALGSKPRPIACGDVLRRIMGGTCCSQLGTLLADYFEAYRRSEVTVPGGVETMAMRTTLAFRGGLTTLAYDGRSAFNSLCRSSILPGVAEMARDVALYTNNLYVRIPPKLLCRVDDGRTEITPSARAVQQGCKGGRLAYSVSSLSFSRDFREDPPVKGA